MVKLCLSDMWVWFVVTTSPLCWKALQWPYQSQMKFENQWWLTKCAKVVLKHNFLLQNAKIFQSSGEAHLLIKRHVCCFISAKSENWNFWALTHQPLVQMFSNFVSVTIFGCHCHLIKIKVFGLIARSLEFMEWVEIMIWKWICHGNFHPNK